MSERSWTPGPWVIEPHGKGFALYSGRDALHHGMNLVYLSEPDSNWEANARLIAAAPEMLGALERIRAELILQYSPYVYQVNFKYIDEAIQKATNER